MLRDCCKLKGKKICNLRLFHTFAIDLLAQEWGRGLYFFGKTLPDVCLPVPNLANFEPTGR